MLWDIWNPFEQQRLFAIRCPSITDRHSQGFGTEAAALSCFIITANNVISVCKCPLEWSLYFLCSGQEQRAKFTLQKKKPIGTKKEKRNEIHRANLYQQPGGGGRKVGLIFISFSPELQETHQRWGRFWVNVEKMSMNGKRETDRNVVEVFLSDLYERGMRWEIVSVIMK